ncbi:MAG TPA: lipopolysaccharide assembly protein LapA domain-containing protein [Reyranella sp.]|nr:lipopolysaccharide assembly protein LapA domain-containing protein [Reyranella sp.]
MHDATVALLARMKVLSRALFLVFLMVGVLIAVSNTERTELALWPIPHTVVLPLYLLVLAVLLLGVLAGLGLGWWAGRHHRRHARGRRREVQRLEREIEELRAALAAAKPAPAAPAGPAPREQRAIERQTALVAPEPFKG